MTNPTELSEGNVIVRTVRNRRLAVFFLAAASAGVAGLLYLTLLNGARSESAREGSDMTDRVSADRNNDELPPERTGKHNRLIHERSPYLQQHAANPVNWYPWGEEAFELARREDKPVFLSVGYSTCHWCHVMERESFENEEIAAVLNEHFVSIKVDREERPDIDQVYMTVTQILTGSGGWPNSVWLTPDGKPWYAGTYFPPETRYGRIGFKELLKRLAATWDEQRPQVEDRASDIEQVLQQASITPASGSNRFDSELIERLLSGLADRFDAEHGGFGSAPKFPPHTTLALLLHLAESEGHEKALDMAVRTLEGMARGGIRDHVGGGFHRYSTDRQWFLPHFEKMLYDNAQLARLYAHAWRITGREDFREVAEGILEWALREMKHPDGAFYSALDADSEGIEGKFYLWTRAEITEVLGQEEGALFCNAYGVEATGNFREEATGERPGTNILHLPESLHAVAARNNMTRETLAKRLNSACEQLRRKRADRVWPHRDEKILAAWNGLMIGALACCGQIFEEPRYMQAAGEAADFILENMTADDRLIRSWRDGPGEPRAYLDDYAFLASGLLDLYSATGDRERLDQACELMETLIGGWWDEAGGGFYFTAEDRNAVLLRTKDPIDKAVPSGNGIAGQVLVRLDRLTGRQDYLRRFRKLERAFLTLMNQQPQAMQSMILASVMQEEARPGQHDRDAEAQVPDARVSADPLTAELYASRLAATPGSSVRIAVRLQIGEGFHVNAHKPLEDFLIATELSLAESESADLQDVKYPSGKRTRFGFSEREMLVYEGEVWMHGRLFIHEDAPAGEMKLPFELTAQPCDNTQCLFPQTLQLDLEIRVGASFEETEPRHPQVFGNSAEQE